MTGARGEWREGRAPVVYTVGHSNHPADRLLALLGQYEIALVADVRSAPRSRYSPQYNRLALEAALGDVGVRYLFLGDGLGGRPSEAEFYDESGHVSYERLAASRRFEDGMARLLAAVGDSRVALLCSEENPNHCHRRLLVGRVLVQRGSELVHIRGDGRLESEDENRSPDQPPTLFDTGNDSR